MKQPPIRKVTIMKQDELLYAFKKEQERNPFAFLYNTIAAVLKNAIITEQYAPGSTFKDGDLAKLLNVSRTSASRALSILAEQGLLSHTDKNEYAVILPDYTFIRDIMTFRSALEPSIGYEAIKNASQENLAELWQMLQQFKRAPWDTMSTRHFIIAAFRLETGFLEKICNMCANSYLCNAYKANLNQIHRSIYFISRYACSANIDTPDSLVRHFTSIFYALQSGNGRIVMEAVFSYLRRVDIRRIPFEEATIDFVKQQSDLV